MTRQESSNAEVGGPRKGMHVGAIAMIDALAFKGVWDLFESDAVFESMLQTEQIITHCASSVSKHLQHLSGGGRLKYPPEGTALCLSDTIVFALHIPNFEPEVDPLRIRKLEAALTACAVFAVARIVAVAAHAPVPLNYRGAITWGEFAIHRNYLLGPAIDEVAELHQRTDGAFIELTASAEERMREVPDVLPREFRRPLLCFEHDVPIKGQLQAERRMVVNPFAACTTGAELHDVQDGVKRAFRDSEDEGHQRKRRHTMTLMAAAARVWSSVCG